MTNFLYRYNINNEIQTVLILLFLLSLRQRFVLILYSGQEDYISVCIYIHRPLTFLLHARNMHKYFIRFIIVNVPGGFFIITDSDYRYFIDFNEQNTITGGRIGPLKAFAYPGGRAAILHT